jgi:hypothetical protein
MRARAWLAFCLAACMVTFLPPVAADDDITNANPMTNGVSSNGYVCYDDGCSPNDEIDWWKMYAYKGDIVQVSFSGSMNNGAWWCPGDGWEADFSMHDGAGSQVASQAMSDAGSSTTLSTTMPTAGWVYAKIKGKDSWCNDGVDYTLTPSINQDSRDTDEDGFIDTEDDCDLTAGTSTNDRQGCPDEDSDGWSDPDGGWGPNNGADAFRSEPSQWMDSDNDGYGDNLDGFQGDHCPYRRGYSAEDRFGCLDSDGDGWSDADPGGLDGVTEWYAHPQGLGDSFPFEASQWQDTDEDGFGDNWADPEWNDTRVNWSIGIWYDNASTPDACPFVTGYSIQDRYGCPDEDSDGWSDPDGNWTAADGADAFPTIPSQWSDRDGDGWGDNQSLDAEQVDDFPDNPSQWLDTDGDGWGDNQSYGASQVDDFPLIPSQHLDSDGDGYGDNLTGFEADVCPLSTVEEVESGWISWADRFGCFDSDMDGYSNPDDWWISHPDGFADAFPDDESQWHDTDDDGYGDNSEYFDGETWREAWRGDGCVSTEGNSTMDRWGCPDYDGDGYSDPTAHWLSSPGGQGDAWPADPTQWHDRDGDGRGDNPRGTTADVCPDVPGTSVGPIQGGDRWGCHDTDGDGWSDLGDTFPHEPTQWRDSDSDGFGDDPNGHEGDACPSERGQSFFDRLGCRDSDGDGWSDPSQDWPASPWGTADAFPTDRMQWEDLDEDGFGDVQMGALRDDCPDVSGTSYRDVQGCPDRDGDGWSDEYGGWNAAISIMGEDPAASWLSYLILGSTMIFASMIAHLTKMSRSAEALERGLSNPEKEQGGEFDA